MRRNINYYKIRIYDSNMSFRLTLVSAVESSLPVGDRTGEGRGHYANRQFATRDQRRWTDR